MNKPEHPDAFARSQATDDVSDESKRLTWALLLAPVALGVVIIVLILLSRLGNEAERIEGPTSTVQAVSVVTVESRTFQADVSLSGEVRPVRDIQVAAPATGVRILDILVDEGDMVREGQPMARLDTGLATAQTRAAEASVAEAESAASRARRQYERAQALRSSGFISADAIEQRRTEAAAADARLAAQRAQLAEVNARLGGGYVRAPVSGRVIDRMAELGRPVDGQVLFRIAVDNRLEVSAQVAEVDMLALREGQVATFALVDGSAVQGTLTRLPASIDSRTRMGEALFALPSDTRVRPGMYVHGRAALPPREVIAVPQSSVLYGSNQAYVLVVDNASRAQRVNVQLGGRDGVLVEITDGLSTGQRVVGAGATFLQDGEEVRILKSPIPALELPASSEAAHLRAAENTHGPE